MDDSHPFADTQNLMTEFPGKASPGAGSQHRNTQEIVNELSKLQDDVRALRRTPNRMEDDIEETRN